MLTWGETINEAELEARKGEYCQYLCTCEYSDSLVNSSNNNNDNNLTKTLHFDLERNYNNKHCITLL